LSGPGSATTWPPAPPTARANSTPTRRTNTAGTGRTNATPPRRTNGTRTGRTNSGGHVPQHTTERSPRRTSPLAVSGQLDEKPARNTVTRRLHDELPQAEEDTATRARTGCGALSEGVATVRRERRLRRTPNPASGIIGHRRGDPFHAFEMATDLAVRRAKSQENRSDRTVSRAHASEIARSSTLVLDQTVRPRNGRYSERHVTPRGPRALAQPKGLSAIDQPAARSLHRRHRSCRRSAPGRRPSRTRS
jgi:hypothetical protein